MKYILIEGIRIEVIRKNIKNINLRIKAPNGTVKISVPRKLPEETIKSFVLSKLNWIKKHQKVIANRQKELPKKFISGESHFFTGKEYLLIVESKNRKPSVFIDDDKIYLFSRPDATTQKREEIFTEWYREEMKKMLPSIISKWEAIVGVKTHQFGIKKMKTRWGSCNTRTKKIWLNLELIKKDNVLLEYVVLHEIIHLIEPSHNQKFYTLMDKFMPNWKSYRKKINQKNEYMEE